MLAKTQSVALVGTDAHLVEVEIHIGTGVPSFTIVGLPAKSVREAEQRTRAALVSSDEEWKASRLVANLAPGALRKEGTHFDLPLALGILSARDRIDPGRLTGWVAVGELALDGAVRPVRGVLAAALACRSAGLRGLVCPAANATEAALVEDIEIVPVQTLRDCIAWAQGRWAPPPPEAPIPPEPEDIENLAEVRGHEAAKRALEVAAAGGHNLLLVGPPGSGKTMLARRLPGILPPMATDEALDVTRVHSVAGLLGERTHLLRSRAFRTPHHNISLAGMIGGGPGLARPGEASLAHHGVLFLDELTLYRTDVLESLRAPLEEGQVRIARAGGAVCYPCRFALVAAMNPCPCGYAGDSLRACRCSHHALDVYRTRLSGPLLDRFDIQIAMARPSRGDLLGPPQGESSEVVRRRVKAARALQVDRYGSTRTTNASASKRQLEKAGRLSAPARAMVGLAVDSLALSGRGIDRVLRVARSLADLAGEDDIGEEQVGEAISYRTLDGDMGVGA